MRRFELAGMVGDVPVVHGTWVFYLLDSQGLPFQFILDELQQRGWAFNAEQFIFAALASGNYTAKRLKALVEHEGNADAKSMFVGLVDFICKGKALYGE